MDNQPTKHLTIWSDRWRLGALSRTELMNIGMIAFLTGMVYILFHLLGNYVENVNSNSAFIWMIARWGDKESFGADYSHGYLIPFVSLFIVWYQRNELFIAPKKICNWGLSVIVMALLMHWFGAKMQQTRLSLMSVILLLWGIPFYLYGWQVAKILIFPCAYLIFCVPLNFLNDISGPLQQIATGVSHKILTSGLGIECAKIGNKLIHPDGLFTLNVEAPCSGLRSLLAMTALTAVYAYFTQTGLVKKWALFVLSIPIAVAGNVGRIISIALVSINSGQKMGTGLYHDWSGYVLFTIAIALMVLVGKLFNVNYREFYSKWKKAYLSHS